MIIGMGNNDLQLEALEHHYWQINGSKKIKNDIDLGSHVYMCMCGACILCVPLNGVDVR